MVEEKRLKDRILHRIKALGKTALNSTCQYLSLYDAIYSEKKLDTLSKFAECQDIGLRVGAAIGSVAKFLDNYIGKYLAKKTGVKCRMMYMLVCATGLVLFEWLCVKIHRELHLRRQQCQIQNNLEQGNHETDSGTNETTTTSAAPVNSHATPNPIPTTPTFAQVAWDSINGVILQRRTASESSIPMSVNRNRMNVCVPVPLQKSPKFDNIPKVVVDSGPAEGQRFNNFLQLV